jgi:UDP-GlcNAc:undecaprenyl-phosphate/decaprenyl-phosphate GlcNAc-1-phosphate transferase
VWIQALFVTLLTLLLSRLWHRVGWGDAGGGDETHRKLQHHAVPAVGGVVIGAVWFLFPLIGVPAEGSWIPSTLPALPETVAPSVVRRSVACALAVALGVGAIDDRLPLGLGVIWKLLGQGLAGALLSIPWWLSAEHGGAGVPCLEAIPWISFWSMAAIVACNAWNTFDNADGAATSLAALGLLPAVPLAAGAPLGFLVPNLLLRRGRGSGGGPGDPLAYLGDAGSHLLGISILVVPAAWPALLLPLLDLARVALSRLRAGLPPWRGDRRHLAHRLQRRGLGPVPVTLVLLLIASPAVLLADPMGVLMTVLLFVGACLWTRE